MASLIRSNRLLKVQEEQVWLIPSRLPMLQHWQRGGKGSRLRTASCLPTKKCIKPLRWTILIPSWKSPCAKRDFVQTLVKYHDQVCRSWAQGTKWYPQEGVYLCLPSIPRLVHWTFIYCIYFLYPCDSTYFQVIFRAWPPSFCPIPSLERWEGWDWGTERVPSATISD